MNQAKETAFIKQFIDPRYDPTPKTLPDDKPIIYWMLREHRAEQNKALRLAQRIAIEQNVPLHVVVAFRPDLDKHAMLTRTFGFLLEGLKEVEKSLRKNNINFHFLVGLPDRVLVDFAHTKSASLIVTDEFPLPIYRTWYEAVQKNTNIPLVVVDGHNHVPIWIASPKREYAARTFRPKIWKHSDDYVRLINPIQKHPYGTIDKKPIDWQRVENKIKTHNEFLRINKPSGRIAGLDGLYEFASNDLTGYANLRNDPSNDHTSKLSAYFHFGHITSAEVILAVQKSNASKEDKEAFLEEFVVRKELSDNFCYYTNEPFCLRSAPSWALRTLNEHLSDTREYTYSYKEFLYAKTHDAAWNAAQNQLLQTGYMHGYMRMYWAKKILEWTKTPETALEYAIKINDLLELDGRDPNGYVGILWALAGVHDRPWQERDIFGKVRYMNANGLKRKFDIELYIAKWNGK